MPPHGPGAPFSPELAAQHAQWAAHGGPFIPFLGGLMFLLFLLLMFAAVAYLRRTGQVGAPWARRVPSPEHEAREILATRFASGDISSDEFLERASVLNWTPGVDPLPVPRKRRR